MKAKGEEGESLKKREREWGKSFGPEKVLCVGRERKRKRGKKIEKRNRGKSEGDGGFERFSGCRGSSFLFVDSCPVGVPADSCPAGAP